MPSRNRLPWEKLALAGGDSWANGTSPGRELLRCAKVKCVDFPSPRHPSSTMRFRKFPIIESRVFFWNPGTNNGSAKRPGASTGVSIALDT